MCSTSLLYKFLPKYLVACKPAFTTFFTSHLRYTVLWGSIFYTNLGKILLFFALFKPILLQFFTILHSFNIQDDRRTLFLCTTNYITNWLHYKMSSCREFHNTTICSYDPSYVVTFFLSICVIFKSLWYARHFEYFCMRCSCTAKNKRRSDFNCERDY